jgi:hypothetical protein
MKSEVAIHIFVEMCVSKIDITVLGINFLTIWKVIRTIPELFKQQSSQTILFGERNFSKRVHVFLSVYVDASDLCNTAAFQLGSTGIGTTLSSARSWNLKVSFT